MALLTCPECNYDCVSEKANTCPHCGYPINTPTSTKPRIRNGKAIKMPNGYGSIQKLSGKRRNPWRVRKTDGFYYDSKTGRAKQRYINIGYYPTREEAMIALSNYNQNPYDVKANSYTFEEIYNMYLPEKLKTFKNAHSERSLTMAFEHSKPLHKMKMKDIRPSHMEKAIEDAKLSNNSKYKMKNLYNSMFDYAEANGLVDKNYARLMFAVGNTIEVKRKTEAEKNPFVESEIKWLWDNIDNIRFVDVVLMQIYGGWRISELCNITLDNVYLDEGYMIGGSKTEAGFNRVVPIHDDILELVKKRVEEAESLGSQYLLNDPKSKTGLHFTNDKYVKRFKNIMRAMGSEHSTHDCRRTFATVSDRCKIEQNICKQILGHKLNDVTEEAYIKRDIERLKEAVNNMIFISK